MNKEITLDDLMVSESEVLNNIALELSNENSEISASHSSHSSGHSSKGGHYSSTAKVERPLKNKKK